MELIQKKQPNSLIRNGQGDITGLINSSGRTVIEYRYDTWGKDCSYQPEYQEYLDLQELNPFRYRGYVYDTETGWYYLQSRYYDPQVGRFLSADVLLSTGQGVLGHNTYAYCLNNPVNMKDSLGHEAEPVDDQTGKTFKTLKEAVEAAAYKLHAYTKENNVEVGFVISKTKGGYQLSEMMIGWHDGISAANYLDILQDRDAVAVIHTHPNCLYHRAPVFSYLDIAFLRDFNLEGFIVSSDGTLYIYDEENHRKGLDYSVEYSQIDVQVYPLSDCPPRGCGGGSWIATNRRMTR